MVKELLENSIDANSKRIVIELESAGCKLIRVTDDGSGIPPDEIKMAFEKHSTSKISQINDIYNLSTLGFRGEALASIAAVALIECMSCFGKHTIGRKVVLDGGSVRSLTEVGSPKGTTIKVRDLFYNLPARYKYLKSDQTELAHIIDVVTHLAIYHYQIGFKLIHNGSELLNFPSTKNQINNLVNIYGKELVRNLIPFSSQEISKMDDSQNQETKTLKSTQDPGHPHVLVKISGYIGKPSVTRADKSYQSIYVNTRYVESKVVSDAIKDAYRTLVMKNRYPFVILFISIDTSSIDVNISPTKLKIRFEDEQVIYNVVYRTIHDTLKTNDLIPEISTPQRPQSVSLKAITTFGIGRPGYYSSIPTSKLYDERREIQEKGEKDYEISLLKSRPKQSILISELEKTSWPEPSAEIPRNVEGKTTLPLIHPVGQVMDTYIVAQAGDSMLIIDQHAASERIMYEKIKQKYFNMTMAIQELLEPIELELSPRELGFLKTSLSTLEELQFIIDELGENKFYVKGIPIILGRLQDPEFIHDIINDLISLTQDKKPEIIKDKMIQIIACKAAIKAGKVMNIPEIQQLLSDLYSIDNPYTCAHGRPTIISMNETQLKKLFKRIV